MLHHFVVLRPLPRRRRGGYRLARRFVEEIEDLKGTDYSCACHQRERMLTRFREVYVREILLRPGVRMAVPLARSKTAVILVRSSANLGSLVGGTDSHPPNVSRNLGGSLSG